MIGRWVSNEGTKPKSKIFATIHDFLTLRKEVLLAASIIISVLNIAFLMYDFLQVNKSGKMLTKDYFYALMVHSLSLGIICGMLGFVYSAIMEKVVHKILAICSMTGNLFILILRMSFEIVFAGFRPTSFVSTTPDD